MFVQKKWGFGLGTVFSLIVVYFIFLYSRDKGWALLAFASKWYLIVVIGLVAVSFGMILLILLFFLLMLLISMIKLKKLSKKYKKQESKEYIDAEYEVKE